MGYCNFQQKIIFSHLFKKKSIFRTNLMFLKFFKVLQIIIQKIKNTLKTFTLHISVVCSNNIS